nr:YggS family pyridoxal phosphate-dependent enzyme [Bacteroidota bacterium]
MEIRDNLNKIKEGLPENVTLVAVSKTNPVESILKAYNAGQRIFGENKAQELIGKQPLLPGDIRWHFIGHLQTNKVKYLVPFVDMIESVDSFKLLVEINKQAEKIDRTVNCLLQFHIGEEDTKFGLDMEEAIEILTSPEFDALLHTRICGVMGMATFTDNMVQVRNEFKQLNHIFHKLKGEYFPDKNEFKEISMGMSDDYQLAVEEGSTIVRIGSLIFGERNY